MQLKDVLPLVHKRIVLVDFEGKKHAGFITNARELMNGDPNSDQYDIFLLSGLAYDRLNLSEIREIELAGSSAEVRFQMRPF